MGFTDVWRETIAASLYNLWNKIVIFIPELITAIVVLIIGLIFASVMGSLARKIVHFLRLDELAEKTGTYALIRQSGFNITFSHALGWAVKWFFIIAILIAVTDTLGWRALSDFLNRIVLYIPNVIIAVIILAVGLTAGQFLGSFIDKAAGATQANVAPGILGSLAKWALIAFALMASLVQLGIAPSLIQILFAGLVGALALAFGLAGKEKAGHILDQLTQRIHKKP